MPSNNGSFIMVPFAVIDQTGAVVRSGNCDVSMAGMQATEPGQMVLADVPFPTFGVIDYAVPKEPIDEHWYWNGNRLVPYPDRPEGNVTWDGEGWAIIPEEVVIDKRTPEEIETARLARLAEIRTLSYLPKLEFILKIVDLGYISSESGLLLLSGKTSDELDGLIQLLNDRQIFEFQAKMIAASQVDRMDPFIQLATWYMNMTDEEVDALFDIKTENL